MVQTSQTANIWAKESVRRTEVEHHKPSSTNANLSVHPPGASFPPATGQPAWARRLESGRRAQRPAHKLHRTPCARPSNPQPMCSNAPPLGCSPGRLPSPPISTFQVQTQLFWFGVPRRTPSLWHHGTILYITNQSSMIGRRKLPNSITRSNSIWMANSKIYSTRIHTLTK